MKQGKRLNWLGITNSMHVYIETYGCSSSRNDSEIMAGLLERAGHIIVEKIDNADAIIINTCIVKSVTENKIVSRIKKVQQQYKGKRLVIAGCMPAAQRSLVKKIAPTAALISTNSINDISKALYGGEFVGKKFSKAYQPKIRRNAVIDIVEICSGCSHSCSYCITKFAKGSLFSYPAKKIIKEIAEMHSEGVKEFWITGQNIAEYNYDGTNLPKLIENIADSVKGKYFLRLGMMNPADVFSILNDLIDAYKNGHVFKFLHIPVQSGSDEVLEKMERNYTAEDFVEIVKKFRVAIPEITIWTDIIVGFPGESEEDFFASMNLLKQIQPDFTNISAFGSRPKTKAAKMKKVPTEIVKERTRKMAKIVNELAEEKNKKWLNKETEILIDEYSERNKNFLGRNLSYKQIAVKGSIALGDTINVKITKATKTHLDGEII